MPKQLFSRINRFCKKGELCHVKAVLSYFTGGIRNFLVLLAIATMFMILGTRTHRQYIPTSSRGPGVCFTSLRAEGSGWGQRDVVSCRSGFGAQCRGLPRHNAPGCALHSGRSASFPRPPCPPALAVRPVLATLFFFFFLRTLETYWESGEAIFKNCGTRGVESMPKEAKCLASSSGSVVREHP